MHGKYAHRAIFASIRQPVSVGIGKIELLEGIARAHGFLSASRARNADELSARVVPDEDRNLA